MNWLVIILLIAAVAVVVWYFFLRKPASVNQGQGRPLGIPANAAAVQQSVVEQNQGARLNRYAPIVSATNPFIAG